MIVLIGVFLFGLVFFHVLERLYPIRTDYHGGPSRRGYVADFTASIINGPVTSSLAKIGAIYVVLWIPRLNVTGMAAWSWWVQMAVFLLVNDFARYWLHRWYHRSDLLWRFHRVHHTVVEMDALSAFRVHLGETVIKYGLIVLPFYLLHVDKSVIIVYGAIDVLKGFWHHANLRTRIGPLNYVLNSAELHWWHHSVEAKPMNSNYGSIFSIWDRLFGTFYYVPGEWPEQIGVDGMETFPDTYHGLLTSVRYTDDEARAAYRPAGARQADAECQSGGTVKADALPSEGQTRAADDETVDAVRTSPAVRPA